MKLLPLQVLFIKGFALYGLMADSNNREYFDSGRYTQKVTYHLIGAATIYSLATAHLYPA